MDEDDSEALRRAVRASLDGTEYERVRDALARGADEDELQDLGVSPRVARKLARLAWHDDGYL